MKSNPKDKISIIANEFTGVKNRQCDRIHTFQNSNNLNSLGNEIRGFYSTCALQNQEINKIMQVINTLSNTINMKFSLFGSVALGLACGDMDLDLQLEKKKTLHDAFRALKQFSFDNLVSLIRAKVPVIKLKKYDLCIDICSFTRVESFTQYVNNILNGIPAIRNTIFYLKRILKSKGMCSYEYFSSTALIYMVCHFYLYCTSLRSNYLDSQGAFFLAFLYYYINFPYDIYAIKLTGVIKRENIIYNEMINHVIIIFDQMDMSNNVTKALSLPKFKELMDLFKGLYHYCSNFNFTDNNRKISCLGGIVNSSNSALLNYPNHKGLFPIHFNRGDKIINVQLIERYFMINFNELAFMPEHDLDKIKIEKMEVDDLLNETLIPCENRVNSLESKKQISPMTIIDITTDKFSRVMDETVNEFHFDKSTYPITEVEKLITLLERSGIEDGEYFPEYNNPTRCFNCKMTGHKISECGESCVFCYWYHNTQVFHTGECSQIKSYVENELKIMFNYVKEDTYSSNPSVKQEQFIYEQFMFSRRILEDHTEVWLMFEYYLVRLGMRWKPLAFTENGLRYHGLRETSKIFSQKHQKTYGYSYFSKEFRKMARIMPNILYVDDYDPQFSKKIHRDKLENLK